MQIDAETLGDLVDDVPDAVVIVDADRLIHYANPAVRDVFGYAPEELIGRDYQELVPESVRAAHSVNHELFLADPSARPMGTGLDLYGRRRDGADVPVEIALVPLRGSAFVAAFIRDITVRRRLQERLQANNDLVTSLLAGSDAEETHHLVAHLARRLLNARICWLGALDEDAGTWTVLASSGNGVVTDAPESPLPASALVGPAGPVVLDDAGNVDLVLPGADVHDLAQVLSVRVHVEDVATGLLVFARSSDDQPFQSLDIEIASQFASTTALALDLLRARDERLELQTIADHDRIARDLHDTVIQRIFAVALRLESSIQVTSGPVAERMSDAVGQLDEVIRELRSSIFNLQRPLRGGSGLRDRVQEVVDEYRETLGFAPRVGFRGAVDTLVPERYGNELLAALREALSNVARHAHASDAEVVVSADDLLEMTVADDGIGPPSGPHAGHGLDNLRARAAGLGGGCDVGASDAGGTAVRWWAPLDDSSAGTSSVE